MEINQTIQNLTITDYTHQGDGIAKHQGRVIFVKKAIINEIVDIKIIALKAKIPYAEIIKFHTTSPNRLPIEDPNYEQSGVTNLMHMTYPEQLNMKQLTIQNTFTKSQLTIPIDPIIPSPTIYNYRNKVIMPITNIDHQLVSGYYAEQTHNFIPIQNCAIQDQQFNQIRHDILTILNNHSETAYDPNTQTGNIRGIYLRKSNAMNQVMLIIISNLGKIKKPEEFIKRIELKHPNITSIQINHNNSKTTKLLGKKYLPLKGHESILEQIQSSHFKVSPNTFFQINPHLTQTLFETALNQLELTKDDILLDAFCGSGVIGILAAPQVKTVIGVDNTETSIYNAKANAKINHIDNATFICDDIENVFNKPKNNLTFNTLIIDPPRRGVETRFMNFITKTLPAKIAYISCNPATLTRDLKILTQSYNITKVTPLDMFPQTYHLETVAILKLK